MFLSPLLNLWIIRFLIDTIKEFKGLLYLFPAFFITLQDLLFDWVSILIFDQNYALNKFVVFEKSKLDFSTKRI